MGSCRHISLAWSQGPGQHLQQDIGAFRAQAEEAISRHRQGGDPNPVVLLLHQSSPYAGRLANRLETYRQAVEVPHYADDVRAFVLPRALAVHALRPQGRAIWGLDFGLHLGRRLPAGQFFEVSLRDDQLKIRHCWPSPIRAA